MSGSLHHGDRVGKAAPPPLHLWRLVLHKNGIRGVLRKTDPRYPAIRREYDESRKHHGAGFFSNIAKSALKSVAPKAIDALSGLVKDKIAGSGVRKGRKGRKGDGFGSDLLGSFF